MTITCIPIENPGSSLLLIDDDKSVGALIAEYCIPGGLSITMSPLFVKHPRLNVDHSRASNDRIRGLENGQMITYRSHFNQQIKRPAEWPLVFLRRRKFRSAQSRRCLPGASDIAMPCLARHRRGRFSHLIASTSARIRSIAAPRCEQATFCDLRVAGATWGVARLYSSKTQGRQQWLPACQQIHETCLA